MHNSIFALALCLSPGLSQSQCQSRLSSRPGMLMKHSEVVQPDHPAHPPTPPQTSPRLASVHCLPGELWECAKTLNTFWVFSPKCPQLLGDGRLHEEGRGGQKVKFTGGDDDA